MKVLDGFLRPIDVELLRHLFEDRRDQFEPGQQGTGYRRLRVKDEQRLAFVLDEAMSTISIGPIEIWDAFLLHYPTGALIPEHLDDAAVFKKRHARINAMVVEPRAGGVLTVDGNIIRLRRGDAYVFEPDREKHGVSVIEDGERLMLSVGAWI